MEASPDAAQREASPVSGTTFSEMRGAPCPATMILDWCFAMAEDHDTDAVYADMDATLGSAKAADWVLETIEILNAIIDWKDEYTVSAAYAIVAGHFWHKCEADHLALVPEALRLRVKEG